MLHLVIVNYRIKNHKVYSWLDMSEEVVFDNVYQMKEYWKTDIRYRYIFQRWTKSDYEFNGWDW